MNDSATTTGAQNSPKPAIGSVRPIVPCLWFDKEGEEAARFYVSIFPKSELGAITRYGKEGFEIHGRPEGAVMTVTFRLNGQEYTALNGGPMFKFNEAISLQVLCDSQEEIDYYWSRLSVGGEEGPCGWLKDRFGLSWQVTPVALSEMLKDKDPARAGRVTQAFLQMKKFDIAKLRQAYEG